MPAPSFAVLADSVAAVRDDARRVRRHPCAGPPAATGALRPSLRADPTPPRWRGRLTHAVFGDRYKKFPIGEKRASA